MEGRLMNNKMKYITIEEKVKIPFDDITVYGEIDPANLPEQQYRTISSREFGLEKLDAKASLKVSKLLIAKILPMLDTFMPAVFGTVMNAFSLAKLGEVDNLEDMLSAINLESVSRSLDLIDDNDLDKIIDISLRHCYEKLPAGAVKVLNSNGTFGVADIEYDMILVIRLTAEVLLWSVGGFFDASRWISMLGPLAASFPQLAKT
jgi:hypothetical protein